MDLISDFQILINKNTAKSVKILKGTFKNVGEGNLFYKAINRYYTGMRVLFEYLPKDERRSILLNNILMNMCSLMYCVTLKDIKLIYFLYRNTIECLLRYISEDYESRELEKLFLDIDQDVTGYEKICLEKYKSQIKYLYTEACHYIHTDVTRMPKEIKNMKQYDTHRRSINLSKELEFFKRLSYLIVIILIIKNYTQYDIMKKNSKAYLNDILTLEGRKELKSILLEKKAKL